jgi:hypothetical protein
MISVSEKATTKTSTSTFAAPPAAHRQAAELCSRSGVILARTVDVDDRDDTDEFPFCDACREGCGFIEDGPYSGWCGDCFGGHALDAIEEAGVGPANRRVRVLRFVTVVALALVHHQAKRANLRRQHGDVRPHRERSGHVGR